MKTHGAVLRKHSSYLLTDISLMFLLWELANSADPGQSPQYAASDQSLHYLLAECSIEI